MMFEIIIIVLENMKGFLSDNTRIHKTGIQISFEGWQPKKKLKG